MAENQALKKYFK